MNKRIKKVIFQDYETKFCEILSVELKNLNRLPLENYYQTNKELAISNLNRIGKSCKMFLCQTKVCYSKRWNTRIASYLDSSEEKTETEKIETIMNDGEIPRFADF